MVIVFFNRFQLNVASVEVATKIKNKEAKKSRGIHSIQFRDCMKIIRLCSGASEVGVFFPFFADSREGSFILQVSVLYI